MSNEKNETIADIVREMRNDMPRVIDAKVILRNYADRIEAAYKRMEDSIHRAMVLNVGIEMEDFRNPPRLSTALDDIYYALSDALGIRDALGTDGYVSTDIEEAKAIGRHFVIKSYGNEAKMRAALEDAEKVLDDSSNSMYGIPPHMNDLLARIRAALSAPPRNLRMKTLEQLGISPAPWRINDHASVLDRYSAIISGQYGQYNWHNAHLIAAAPKLYAACYEMLRYYYEQNTNTTVFNTALELMKQAVAEAAGESEVEK